MKTLMFGWEFPPYNSGGLGTACFGLTKALTEKGVEVIFVLPKKFPIHLQFLNLVFADSSDIELNYVNSPLYPYMTEGAYKMMARDLPANNYGESLFEEVQRYARKASKIAKERKFDIIHAHDWLSFPAGMAAKKVSGKPLVAHVHATEIDRSGGNYGDDRVFEIEREGMMAADRVITVSNYTRKMVTDYYNVDPEKIRVVHNGINQPTSPLTQKVRSMKRHGQKIVLFVGRITLMKGPDYFLNAAKKVLEYLPNTIFIMAGSGDMERQMIETAASLGIGDRVVFPGFVRGTELDDLYQAADLFVQPSVSEPFGITALESLSQGTPVIISKQTGVSEVLTHSLKVDFWDVEEMANMIISVLQNRPLHHELSKNGARQARERTWAISADKCKNVYTELVV